MVVSATNYSMCTIDFQHSLEWAIIWSLFSLNSASFCTFTIDTYKIEKLNSNDHMKVQFVNGIDTFCLYTRSMATEIARKKVIKSKINYFESVFLSQLIEIPIRFSRFCSGSFYYIRFRAVVGVIAVFLPLWRILSSRNPIIRHFYWFHWLCINR